MNIHADCYYVKLIAIANLAIAISACTALAIVDS